MSAPAPSALFVVKDAKGQPHGVTVDLGSDLARTLGVPVSFLVAPNSGELTRAVSSGSIDVTFLPVDEARTRQVDFGPAYYVFESTYLIRPGSDIRTLAGVDRPGVRVVGIANTATIRSAAGSLKNTTITAVKSVDEAMQMLRSGKSDAFALGRDPLPSLAARLPGSRILDESFLRGDVAIALPKNRPNAHAYVTTFMENAKASGVVRRAFDDAGLRDLAVASPAPKQP
ncbi:MAG TPA: transporter substrate-binding domain-containing protein [Casimicrobiaceae bacterium]